MKTFKLENLKQTLENNSKKTVLYGAGLMGRIALYYLIREGIEIDCFCDSDIRRRGEIVENLKIITPEDLNLMDKNINILISNKYLNSVSRLLDKNSFKNVFDCADIIGSLDLDDFYKKNSSTLEIKGGVGSFPLLKLKREAEFYIEMCKKARYVHSNYLHIKSVDIQITERCSAKCQDCSNLMQYYVKPGHADMNQLFKSIDNFMGAVDELDEFRVIGGDALMHKEMHKVVNKLKNYNSRIIIYTNAKIVPKDQNLECLKHPNVIVDITNYGNEASLAHDKLVTKLKEEKIAYSTNLCDQWQDSGRILPNQERSEDKLNHLFDNCCNNELISILHGKLYRCPFSANATNLKAIPYDGSDVVRLDIDRNLNDIRNEIYNLSYNKKSLTACNYCNGRDYSTKWIPAAVQLKKPLSYKKID